MQVDLMMRNIGTPRPHCRMGETFLSSLAVCLGGFTSFLGSIFVPLVAGLFLVGWSLLAALQLGRLQVDEAVTRVSSGSTMTRIRSSVSGSSMRLVGLAKGTGRGWGDAAAKKQTAERRSPKISAPEPFLPLDKIAELSLPDLKDLMRYAQDVNRLDFCSRTFLSTLHPGARESAEAIKRVAAESRGSKNVLSTPSPLRGGDAAVAAAANTDALSFAAAVRVYAEWRSLRLVPEGYQRYAVAMNLAKRDLLQNVQKIEAAAHSWMLDREGDSKSAVSLATGRQVSSKAEVFACRFLTVAVSSGVSH